MLHNLTLTWFQWVHDGGYFGITVLMAMESSIIPVPSEIVIAPAAFWAAQGKLNLLGVIFSGTLGSYIGSALSYWVASWLGRPLLLRFGKFLHLDEQKMIAGERFVLEYGRAGIFASRLLPVVRHLISIPAGILRMSFLTFSVMTIIGSGIWCTVLSWFGMEILGRHPELLESPSSMVSVIHGELGWIAGAVIFLLALYVGIHVQLNRMKSRV